MKSLYLILFSLLLCFSIKAEGTIYERVYVHTDKDCYVAGEDILMKFLKLHIIPGNLQPIDLSKIGYVEICDTEKPWMQLKVALEDGKGAGKIKIPGNLPSGIYRLSGYTRYMRNEGENVFFEKQIAVVNAGQPVPDPKRFELVEKQENIQQAEHSDKKRPTDLSVRTDQSEYGNRKKVFLFIDNIPDDALDLVVSVTGNDSIAFVPEINKREWLKPVESASTRFSGQWLPEYEGHIVTGRIVPEPGKEQLLSGIAFVGKDIRYFNGQINPQNGTVSFYTAGIFGKQQLVTSVISSIYDKTPYRLDLLTPFCETLPDHLPVLQIYPNEKQIMDRYIGVQMKEKTNNDSGNNPIPASDYCTFQPVLSYNLDEYTRFTTISETILEFVNKVRVTKVGGSRKIRVYLEEGQRFNIGNTLVLLDGIPIYDHEEILRYNPMHVKKINVYDGRYLFGGEDFECIVSFITGEGNLPFFQLSEGSQLFDYDCPQLPSLIEIPDYSIDEIRNSKKPNFRHTLYWNPFIEFTKGLPVNLSFYTSDLCGEFKITVEGITATGKTIRGVSYFQVEPHK